MEKKDLGKEEGKLGESLTLKDFFDLVKYIDQNHRFGDKGKMVKYIYPSLDMRDGRIFHISFRGMFDPVCEGIAFDFRDNSKPMRDNIYEWLNETENASRKRK